MKIFRMFGFFIVLLLVIATPATAQEKGSSGKKLEINEANVLGVWWVKHDLGSLDGYQLERGGKLTLVNLYSWYGDRWELHKDTMTWVMYADKQNPETARYIISNLTPTGFALMPLTANAGDKRIPFYKHTGTRVTDAWVGRWTGTEGSYLEIIPDSLNYKIVIEVAGKSGEYKGSTENDRIKFTRKGVVEYIAAGDGKSTGLKPFEKRKNCLIVKKTEAYCRDNEQ